MMNVHLRPSIRSMTGYTPGEQPRDDNIIKLNTNENPYPPSPRVFEAIRAALTGDRLRKYPEPLGHTFRATAGRALGVDPESILIGNGSDDVLTILTRAFVPEGGLIASMTPSYLLYRTLAEIQGARFIAVPFSEQWGLPSPWPIRGAHLTFLTNPNSPSGTQVPLSGVERLLDELDGPLVLDEAYGDFAESNGLFLSARPNVIVTRTLSKSYSLAGIRFGFAVAEPALIRQLVKVKDSYNCDVLSLAAATAALEDQDYMLSIRAKILTSRKRLTGALRGLGFEVCPSATNFLWCTRADRPVKPIYEQLKDRRILVRYMTYEGIAEGLRITVGTDSEIDQLLQALRGLV